MKIKGTFTSIWDDGVIETPATLDLKTGNIKTKKLDVPDMGSLISENFISSDGKEYEICSECHNNIIHNNVCLNEQCL